MYDQELGVILEMQKVWSDVGLAISTFEPAQDGRI